MSKLTPAIKESSKIISKIESNKIDWKKLIEDKWSYDINMTNIMRNIVNRNNIEYSRELYHSMCFAEKWCEKSGRYYILLENMVENMMLEVILNNGI